MSLCASTGNCCCRKENGDGCPSRSPTSSAVPQDIDARIASGAFAFRRNPGQVPPSTHTPTSGVTGITYFCAAPIHLRVDHQTEGCYDEYGTAAGSGRLSRERRPPISKLSSQRMVIGMCLRVKNIL